MSIFAATDVAGQPFDKFAIVTGGPTQANAVATTDAPATLYAGSFKVADYASFSKVPPPQLKQMVRYTKAADIVLPNDGAVRASDALLVANDPLTNLSIYAWMVDLAGNTLSPRLTVYEKGGSVDTPRGVQVGAGFMVMWREMGDTTTLWGRPIGCF